MRLEPSPEIASGEKTLCRAGDREILVCRQGEDYFAIAPRCPHAAWPLEHEPFAGLEIHCTLHGARFDVTVGCPTAGPTTKQLKTYPIEQRDGALCVRLSA